VGQVSLAEAKHSSIGYHFENEMWYCGPLDHAIAAIDHDHAIAAIDHDHADHAIAAIQSQGDRRLPLMSRTLHPSEKHYGRSHYQCLTC